MVLLNSRRIPRAPRYLGVRSRKPDLLYLQAYRLVWRAFPGSSVINQVCNFPTNPKLRSIESYDTKYTTLSNFNIYPVWAVSLSLAATRKITVVFYS